MRRILGRRSTSAGADEAELGNGKPQRAESAGTEVYTKRLAHNLVAAALKVDLQGRAAAIGRALESGSFHQHKKARSLHRFAPGFFPCKTIEVCVSLHTATMRPPRCLQSAGAVSIELTGAACHGPPLADSTGWLRGCLKTSSTASRWRRCPRRAPVPATFASKGLWRAGRWRRCGHDTTGQERLQTQPGSLCGDGKTKWSRDSLPACCQNS